MIHKRTFVPFRLQKQALWSKRRTDSGAVATPLLESNPPSPRKKHHQQQQQQQQWQRNKPAIAPHRYSPRHGGGVREQYDRLIGESRLAQSRFMSTAVQFPRRAKRFGPPCIGKPPYIGIPPCPPAPCTTLSALPAHSCSFCWCGSTYLVHQFATRLPFGPLRGVADWKSRECRKLKRGTNFLKTPNEKEQATTLVTGQASPTRPDQTRRV